MFRLVLLAIGLAVAASTCATPVSAIANDYLAAVLIRYPEQAQQNGLPRMFAVLPVAPVRIQPIPAFNEKHSVPY